MEKFTLKNWHKKGIELFGADIKKWNFKCPSCGGIQNFQDFLDNGVEDANQRFYFSCIGRWVKNRGCDWTLGGFLQIHKVEVEGEDGEAVTVFEFAEKAIKL